MSFEVTRSQLCADSELLKRVNRRTIGRASAADRESAEKRNGCSVVSEASAPFNSISKDLKPEEKHSGVFTSGKTQFGTDPDPGSSARPNRFMTTAEAPIGTDPGSSARLKRLLTTAEAAEFTGLSEYELRKGASEGRYPVILLGSPSNRFRKMRWNLDMLNRAIFQQIGKET